MKRAIVSFLLICALAIAGSAQTTAKKPGISRPMAKSKIVTQTSTSSSTAKASEANSATTAPHKTGMVKPKHHYKGYKGKKKTTK
jgi:hypothetical protein